MENEKLFGNQIIIYAKLKFPNQEITVKELREAYKEMNNMMPLVVEAIRKKD